MILMINSDYFLNSIQLFFVMETLRVFFEVPVKTEFLNIIYNSIFRNIRMKNGNFFGQ
jgi:hypothetical protein